MPNSIGSVFGNLGGSPMVSTSDTTPQQNYTPENIKPKYVPEQSSAQQILGSLMNFAQSSSQIYQSYSQDQTKQGDLRSNRILESMNNDQISNALQNGTLQYQDDPYTMNQLKQKMASQASTLVDGQIQKNIQNGIYNTPQEMSDDAQKLRSDAFNQLAQSNGWSTADEHLVNGFSAGVEQRNLALNQTQQSFTSNQIKQQKALTDGVSINEIINNSQNQQPADVANSLYNYIQTNRASSDDKMNMISQVNTLLAKTPGGAAVLQQLQQKNFNLYGQSVNYDQIYGKSGTDTFVTRAGQATYDYSKQNRDDFNNQLSQIGMMTDPNQAMAMIQQVSNNLNKQQPGQQLTDQQNQLEQVKHQIQEKLQRQSLLQKAVFQKQAQADNRASNLLQQYSASASGNTSAVTDIKGQTTNEQMGNYTVEDSVNAANQYYNNVMNNKNLTQEQKDNYIMTLSQNTPQGQGINILLNNKMDQAQNEISSAALSGSLDFTKTPQLNAFMSMYKSDPTSLAHALGTSTNGQQLYSTIATISGMNDAGLDPSSYIIGQQKINAMDQAQKQDLQNNTSNWQKSTRSNSSMPTISGLGWTTANNIFKNTYAATGNVDFATNQAGQWLTNNIIPFHTDDVGYEGGVMKSSLKLSSDPASTKIGQEILNNKVHDLLTQYPVLKGKLFVSNDAAGNTIIGDSSGALKSVTGQTTITLTRQDMQNEYHEHLKQYDENATQNIVDGYQLRQENNGKTTFQKIKDML